MKILFLKNKLQPGNGLAPKELIDCAEAYNKSLNSDLDKPEYRVIPIFDGLEIKSLTDGICGYVYIEDLKDIESAIQSFKSEEDNDNVKLYRG
jgi:hypothetical protein